MTSVVITLICVLITTSFFAWLAKRQRGESFNCPDQFQKKRTPNRKSMDEDETRVLKEIEELYRSGGSSSYLTIKIKEDHPDYPIYEKLLKRGLLTGWGYGTYLWKDPWIEHMKKDQKHAESDFPF